MRVEAFIFFVALVILSVMLEGSFAGGKGKDTRGRSPTC
jgi:hypothetical protein